MKLAFYITLLLIAFNVTAGEERYYPKCCIEGVNGSDGSDGKDGKDGINGKSGRNGVDGSYYNDDALTRMIAIGSAMSAVPNISHADGEHKHSNVGIGFGGNNDNQAVAVGINHMRKNISYKATVGKSGDESAYGIGAGFNF